MPSKTLSLRFKFITGLVLFAMALGICISIIIYFHLNNIMQSEISQRSRMLLAQSTAVQDYVKTVLRPEMFNTLPKGRFLLKAMSSSYISRQVMARLNEYDTTDFHYRRVSIKPRNLESTPNDFERNLISVFNKNKELKTWEEDTMVKDQEYHMVARPVTFSESCMQCHGDPSDAPKEMTDIYGDKNGFNYIVGDVGGVVVAGFPVAMIQEPVKEVTLRYLIFYFLGILFFAALISLFFDRLVMKNLHELTLIFKTRFSGQQEQGIIDKLGQKDEIEGLIEGVDELAGCLSDARNELEDYAQNLEFKVEDRTKELKLKAKKHLGDVRLFVKVLSGFKGSIDTRHLLSGVLESVGKRFDADQVIYHCTAISENAYSWKPEKKISKLDADIKELLWKDEILIREKQLYIPIKSSETHWGILCIAWAIAPLNDDLDPAILLALGQQVGILIENIHAFSNIRFQNDMLQSIVEGISDPLLLIDSDCHIIIANKGSKSILTHEKRDDQQRELKKFLCLENAFREPCNILQQVIKKETPISEEIKTSDGKYFSIDLYPLPRHDQSMLRIVMSARDITMEKQMKEQMQQAERLSAIGKMAAGLAHEINNPLGVIQCYTDLVKDTVENPDTLKDIDVILKHTRNVQTIVKDLLHLSRPKQVLSGICSINTAVTNAMEVFKTQSASKEISVKSYLKEDLPDIKCDAAILEQILTNLWLNAFDALQESGGDITISTGLAKDNQVLLSIEDNGPGIPDHVISQIFDPFYTTKDVGKGTGLGLSVVYGFINELGGRIEVESNDTTIFNLFFPADRPKIKS
jgi:two-component system, NtrC family, sensor kinase